MPDSLSRRPSRLVAARRLLRGAWHIAQGWRQIRFEFDRLGPAERAERVSHWARELLRIWHIDLRVAGVPQGHATLLIANHISWLDIIALLATSHCRFVGKSELARWPVLGTMIAGAGTVFVERASKRDVRRVVTEIQEALQQGKLVAVFPEGTTTAGHSARSFHPNLFEAAILSGAPVQPVSIRYRKRHSGAISMAPAYVGEDSLITTVWRTLRARPFSAQVHFLPADTDAGRNRRVWAADVRSVILADLADLANLAGDQDARPAHSGGPNRPPGVGDAQPQAPHLGPLPSARSGEGVDATAAARFEHGEGSRPSPLDAASRRDGTNG